MKLFLSLLAIITFLLVLLYSLKPNHSQRLKNEIIEDAARPGVSPFST